MARFGLKENDVVLIRAQGHGQIASTFFIKKVLDHGFIICSTQWDAASDNWLKITTIRPDQVLEYIGHSFDKKKAKENWRSNTK